MKALKAHIYLAAIVPAIAFAGAPGNADIGFVDNILRQFQSAAAGWQSIITDAATHLFGSLAIISLVWTFGMMALKKADITEFAAEFIRFIILTGFWFWLLINGPQFATAIIDGLAALGAQAGGLTAGPSGFSPSSLVHLGLDILSTVIDQSSFWPDKLSLTLFGGLLALAILVMLCLIAVNMVLLLVSAWMLAYAGIFILGFGGARWTSDMAQNYYRTVLGLGLQMMAMTLLVGVGKTFIDSYYASLQADISLTNLKSMGALMVACFFLCMLITKIPPMLGGVVSGASAGSGIGGAFGFGTLAAAAGMIGGAIATGGSSLVAGGAAAAGGAQALMAAFTKASASVQSSDTSASSSGSSFMSSSGESGGGGGSGSGSTPFAEAAGFGGFGSAISKAARITGRAGMILAENAMGTMRQKAGQRIGQTFGGKLASAIQAQPSPPPPTFDGNSLEAPGGNGSDSEGG